MPYLATGKSETGGARSTDSQTSIDFCSLCCRCGAEHMAEQLLPNCACNIDKYRQNRHNTDAKGICQSTANIAQTGIRPFAPENQKKSLSADRLKELCEHEDVRQILFLAESYLGTTLSMTVTDELLYIYEELHFS